MAYQKRDGSFTLWPNEYKKDSKHPDFKTGKSGGTLGGVEYEAALWKRKTEDGRTYLSLSIKPAGERPTQKRVATQQDIEEFFT